MRRRSGLTTRASCLLAAGITAVLCGMLLGETDLVRAGVLAAAIPGVAAFVVHRSRVRVANRRSVDPQRAVAGEGVTISLTITNRSVLPTGALMLEDELPSRLAGRARFVLDSLTTREVRTVSYRLPTLGRGRYRVGPLRIRLGDPFGMIELTRSFTATSEFLVTPAIDPLPPSEPRRSEDLGNSAGSRSVGTHGADDASTREYCIGDDLRKIHWRSSARTGKLMVRQEERPWRTQTAILLDLRPGAHATSPEVKRGARGADPRRTSSLEWAVSAAASIGHQGIRSGRTVGLIDDPLLRERRRFGNEDVLADHLASTREWSRGTFVPLAGLIRTTARDSALVAILGRVGPDELALLAAAYPRGGSSPAYAMVLDVDSWASDDEAADALDGAAPAPRRSPAESAAAVLRDAGWRAVVVRRGTTTPQAWQVLLAGPDSSAARFGTALDGPEREPRLA